MTNYECISGEIRTAANVFLLLSSHLPLSPRLRAGVSDHTLSGVNKWIKLGMYVHYYSFLSAYVDLLLSCKQAPMLIIQCLQMHFYPAPLLSCRLEGLELSVSSPWSSRNTQFQLSGSAALIIIWPHLFGRLRESWIPSRTLRARFHPAAFLF